MKIKLQKNKGFTLIEVLISLAVFAIIIIPISLIIMQGVNTNKKAEQKQQGMMMVQDIMENIKALSENEFMNLVDLNIKDGKISFDGEKITGKVDGYNIEGNIKPVDGYNFKNETLDLSNGYVVNIIEETENIKVVVEDTKLICKDEVIAVYKDSKNKVFINNNKIIDGDSKKEVYLIINESCKKHINFELKNDSKSEGSIYIIKKETSEALYEVTNRGGSFNIVSDVIIPDNDYLQDKKLYEINIKASKNGESFEVSSYKNIKE